jgi:trans-aconitate methyltransferase
VAPFVIFAEVQIGAWLRTGRPHAMTKAELQQLSLWDFVVELALGTVVVGGLVAIVSGLIVWLVLRRAQVRHPKLRLLIETTDRPYLESGMHHWEFVRAKLRWDPVFVYLAASGVLPDSGRLVDVGCGRGILLSLIRSAEEAGHRGELPPDWSPRRQRPELHGVDSDLSAVEIAREALRDGAEIECADLLEWQPPPCRAAVLLDVLHYLPESAQDGLLARVVAALEPGGLVILREADANGSRAFRWTALAERLRAVLRGRPRQRFCFRSVTELADRLQSLGMTVERHPMSARSPFENHLLVARRAEAA